MDSASARPRSALLDHLGISASVLCMIHCLAPPVLAMVLPATGREMGSAALVGWATIAAVIGAAGLTLPRGFVRHGDRTPALLAAPGIAALVAGEALSGPELGWGLALTLAGGLAVAAAQFRNLRALRHCSVCGHDRCASPIRPEETAGPGQAHIAG